MARGVPPEPLDEHRVGAAPLTGAQLSAINRFPDDNPNPVMRVDADGRLIYANPASEPVIRTLGVTVGDRLSDGELARLDAVVPERGFVEVVADGRTYAVWPVPIPDLDFTNLYGTDVTAERAIVKFPDQNPNPVMRIDWDGRLEYANPASPPIVDGLGLRSVDAAGGPARRCSSVGEPADRGRLEVEAAGRCTRLHPGRRAGSSASSTSTARTSPR